MEQFVSEHFLMTCTTFLLGKCMNREQRISKENNKNFLVFFFILSVFFPVIYVDCYSISINMLNVSSFRNQHLKLMVRQFLMVANAFKEQLCFIFSVDQHSMPVALEENTSFPYCSSLPSPPSPVHKLKTLYGHPCHQFMD